MGNTEDCKTRDKDGRPEKPSLSNVTHLHLMSLTNGKGHLPLEMIDSYSLNEFHYHEVLDRAYFALSNLEDYWATTNFRTLPINMKAKKVN